MATMIRSLDPVAHFEDTYPTDKTMAFDVWLEQHTNRHFRFVVRSWDRKHPRTLYSFDELETAIDAADCQPEFIDTTTTPVDVFDKSTGQIVYRVVA